MQKYLNSILRQKLGTYLDGLQNTQLSLGVRESSMFMTNVQFRRDAFDKFMLPIDIKFGTIKQLTIKVPLLNIQNSPITIELQGLDLILAPKSEKNWEFPDIFSEEYMKEQLMKIASKVIADIASQQEQGWRDRLKIKVLDNFTMNIRDVHVRFEDISEEHSQRDQIGQTTFGLLLSELDLKTVDTEGNAIFHDRSVTGGKITKVLKMEGMAIYLNPQDTVIIHQIAADHSEVDAQISSMQDLMDQVVVNYRSYITHQRQSRLDNSADQLDTENSDLNQRPRDNEEFLTYILKPMNLDLVYEHDTDATTKSMKISIHLDQLQLSLQHQQLKAMLKLIKTIQTYKKQAYAQEKLRKFRQFRPVDQIEGTDDMEFGDGGLRPGFDTKKWWQFAGSCILRSFQFKRGAIKAFTMSSDLEKRSKVVFQKEMEMLYKGDMDDKKRVVYFNNLEAGSSKLFWHVVSMLTKEQLLEWAKQVITPIEESKYRRNQAQPAADGHKSRLQNMRNWIFGKKDEMAVDGSSKAEGDGQTSNQFNPFHSPAAASQPDLNNEGEEFKDEEELDEFFDCIDTEESTIDIFEEQKRERISPTKKEDETPKVTTSSKTRDRTSFSLLFDIKELSFTLGKLSASNKIEGIQIYNKAVSMVTKAPTLNIDKQFKMQIQIEELGLNLITMNRKTNMIEECVSVIQTNKFNRMNSGPQLDMHLTKNNVSSAANDIEHDLNLSIGQIMFKYNEDLVIRAKAISRLKVDTSLQIEAIDQLEELRENTQSAIHSLIYRRRNRYNISIGSPIFLLPINGTFEGHFSPIWAVRTGALTIGTSDPRDSDEQDNLFENLHLGRNRRSTTKERFNFAKAVRKCMRGKTMPRSRGVDTERFFDRLKVQVSQVGMTYFQSYTIYEHSQRDQATQSKQEPHQINNLPPQFGQQFSSQQQAMLDKDYPDSQTVQTLQSFDVLDEFEINISCNILKKADKVVLESDRERESFKNLPKVSMKVDTSSINVRLSHSIYNNLYNLKNIFNISKEKASEYNKELTQFNVQIKQQLEQEAHISGKLQRKVFADVNQTKYETNHCILSGNYLYFYEDADSLLYIDYFYLKQTERVQDTKNLEVLLLKVNQPAEMLNLRRSTFMKKRTDNFSQEAFDAGTARKLKFESQESMQSWVDKIQAVTVGIVLDWDDNVAPNQIARSSFNGGARESMIDTSSSAQANNNAAKKRIGLNGINDPKGMLALKSFQRNQMHGNFNEMVTTFITTEGSDTSRVDESRYTEADDDLVKVKLELDVSIPTFDVELMKLKLVPGINQVAKPAVFEMWVTFTMLGMSMWLEQRAYDQYQKMQINKVSLTDETMVINRRLMTQNMNTSRATVHSNDQHRLLGLIKHRLGTNENFDEPAIIVDKKTFKKLSPRFEGVYGSTAVLMSNIHINFMPGTYNNIIKMMRATKKQTKPVEDGFMAGEEYDRNAMSASEHIQEENIDSSGRQNMPGDDQSENENDGQGNFDEEEVKEPIIKSSLNDSSITTVTHQKHRNRRYEIDPEQKMLARATEINENRNYDFDCLQETEKPMLVTCVMKRISIGMLHPKYQMEVFRLHANLINCRYEVFYDHGEISCNFQKTTLYDLTGYPYSVNPKKFYKFVKQTPNLLKSPQRKCLENPREMIYFNGLNMKVYQIQSENCPHKVAGFSSKMIMTIDTMRVNHIQELNLRFNDYFMEQFMDCFFMSDPYKDPKKAFDEIRSRSQIQVSQLSQDYDFMFPSEISMMDVQIKNFEMKIKDRPRSKDYLLFEIPLITCERTKGTMDGLIPRKPKLELQAESIWTKCPEVKFWFGRECGDGDLTVQDSRLSLLKESFAITVEYKKLSGSEVIAKISPLEMDKAARVNLTFTPIELIWPQSIYTYMLRCADLNFSFSDGLVEEYFFIKWLDISEHYMNSTKLVSKKFDIVIPALSMTLQNSDGSFIAEMIWKQFRQLQTNYTDTDKEINVSCNQFYILDSISHKSEKQSTSSSKKPQSKNKNAKSPRKSSNLMQAVICPKDSPMFVNGHDIVRDTSKNLGSDSESSSVKNMKIFTRMAPGGDKTNFIDIQGLKIFVKFQTFILLQAFFMNAFPSYKMDSLDKPVGHNEDPERQNTMVVQLNIKDTLICFLNKPGQDSICCKGDITIDMVQESIKRAKEQYEDALRPRVNSGQSMFPELARDFTGSPTLIEDDLNDNGNSTEDSSDKQMQQEQAVAQVNRIYFQKITMNQFTAFICSLEQLDGSMPFFKLKKRQMMNPVNICFENKYLLKHDDQQEEENNSFYFARERLNSAHASNNRSQLGRPQGMQMQRGISVDDLGSDDDDEENQNLLAPKSVPLFKSVIGAHASNSQFGLGAESQLHQMDRHTSYQHQNRRKWVWGVECKQDAIISTTKLRISIQDVHLLYRIVAYSGDMITNESVNKLKEIHDNIEERENIQAKAKQPGANPDAIKVDHQHSSARKQRPFNQYNNYRSFTELTGSQQSEAPISQGADVDRNFNRITEVSLSEYETEDSKNQFQHGQELFEGLIDKLESNFDNTMSSQIARLSASTTAFRKIANGYTQKKYLERGNFLEFLQKDVLTSSEQDGDESKEYQSADEGDITSDNDETGEENRRKTILRINQRNLKTTLQKAVTEEIVLGANRMSSIDDLTGMQSDVLDERSPETVQTQMFNERQGPSSRKKSSQNSSSINSHTIGSGSEIFRSANEEAKKSRFQRSTEYEDARGSHSQFIKESVHDAVSELWQSCSGSVYQKSTLGKGPGSRERTPQKEGKNSESNRYSNSNLGSDLDKDEQLLRGDIEETKDYFEVHQNRSTSQFMPYGPRPKIAQGNSKSFGVALRPIMPNQEQQSTINGSLREGEENSKAFFAHNETMIAQSKRSDHRSTHLHCMDNVLKTESEIFCAKISFLFINDFNSAFTPVTEIEMTAFNVQSQSTKEDDQNLQEISVHKLTGNYFNLELGDWEPMIENMAFNVVMNQTLTQKTVAVKFEGPVILTVTQACLRNFSYTYEAWMSMPELAKPDEAKSSFPAPATKKDNLIKNSQVSTNTMEINVQSNHNSSSNESYSINSSVSDKGGDTALQQAAARNPNTLRLGDFQSIEEEESKNGEESVVSMNFGEDQDQIQEEVIEDNSQIEQFTPFQIKNQTSKKILVYQGGIDVNLGGVAKNARVSGQGNLLSEFNRASVTSGAVQQLAGKKVFAIEKQAQSNYSVSQAQLLDQQSKNQQRQRQHQAAQHSTANLDLNVEEVDNDEEDPYRISGNGFEHLPTKEETQQMMRDSDSASQSDPAGEVAPFITFKNAVIIGVKLNIHDEISRIDMNEISQQDPYVVALSSTYGLDKVESNNDQSEFNYSSQHDASDWINLDQRSDQETDSSRRAANNQQKMKASQLLQRYADDRLGLYYSYIFYGVVLDKMQKQLVIRTPYVFHNKTLLTLQVIIRRLAQDIPQTYQSVEDAIKERNDIFERFTLEPMQKFPLDQMYYYNYSVRICVIDQNSVAIADESSDQSSNLQQQQSVYKPAFGNSRQGSSSQNNLRTITQKGSLGHSSEPDNNNTSTQNSACFKGQKFSEDVLIEDLVSLDLNQGPGVFVSGSDPDSLCLAIKRQPGELFGTHDLVILPTLSVKNCLPCDIRIKRRKRFSQDQQLERCQQSNQEEKTYYDVQKSEQKDFYTFAGQGESGNDISLYLQVQGFLLSDEIVLSPGQALESDIQIQDRLGKRLTLGMKVQPHKAGYQVTFFAHACIILETVRLLNSNSIRVYYEAESIKQQIKSIGGRQKRQMLAGQEALEKNRFIMCNKDQSICVSVMESHSENLTLDTEVNVRASSSMNFRQDYFGKSNIDVQNQSNILNDTDVTTSKVNQGGKAFFFSPGLDTKQAGKLQDFSVKTESAQMVAARKQKMQQMNRKYDFSMNTSLHLADVTDYDSFIFTKIIVVSPKYVFVNHMKAPIEVAQLHTENTQSGRQLMEVNDRIEWFWQDCTKESLVCIRKIGYQDQTYIDYCSSSDQSEDDSDTEDNDKQIESESSLPAKDRLASSAWYHSSQGLEDSSRDSADQTLHSSKFRSNMIRSKKLGKDLDNSSGNQLLLTGRNSSSPKKKFGQRKSKSRHMNNTFGQSVGTKSRRTRKQHIIDESNFTENDRVLEWDWSRGFSPAQNDQMTMAIMVREAQKDQDNSMMNDLKQPQIKVIRVTKKLLNNTVFVIFEDESDLFPMYKIINDCRHVKVSMQQYDMSEPMPTAELVEYQQGMTFGFYEPENEKKIQLELEIDRNDPTNPVSYNQVNLENRISIIDLNDNSTRSTRQIPYQDIAGQLYEIVIATTFDGYTKTVRIYMVHDDQDTEQDQMIKDSLKLSEFEQALLQKQEDENERKKLKKQEPNTTLDITVAEIMVSFVAKVQVSRDENILKEMNRELALLTWQGIKFTSEYKSAEKKHNVEFKVNHFQVDNQSEQNPLFQQIFRAKRQNQARNRGDEEQPIENPFISLEFDYRIEDEKTVTFVDKFYCSVAESVCCIDSELLVNVGWAATRIRPLFENVGNTVHPLFMKQSICSVKDEDVELLNKDESILSRMRQSIQMQRASKDQVGLASSQHKVSQLLLNNENDLEDPLLGRQQHELRFSSRQSHRNSNDIDVFALQQARVNEMKRPRVTDLNLKSKDILTNVMGEILIEDKQCQYTVETAPTHLRLWYQQDVKNNKETLYLREFLIDQVIMDISFVVKTADETSSGSNREHVGSLQMLRMSGLSLINLDEARFRIARFGLQNFFIGREDMMKLSTNFYGQWMQSELQKLVGNVGILASPRSLFYSIGDGFHDFIAMPADGFNESGVLGAAYGMAAGTISLTKQIGVGSLQSFQQFCRDSSQALLYLAKDKDYMRQREDRMIIEKPQHFVDGFGYGANSFIQSLKSGIGGVCTRPVIEARRRGKKGLASGLYQGVAGMVLKPLSGTLDLVSKSAEGSRNTIRRFDVNTHKERVRMPRVFYGLHQKIKKFNRNDSLIVSEVLTQIADGRFKDNHFLEMKIIRTTEQNAHFLMLTEEILFLIEANQKELIWYIKTELIQKVHVRPVGIVITLYEEFEGQDSYVLPVDQAYRYDIQKWLEAIQFEFN